MARNKFYITTAIPYVNAPPHVGHALEFVQADAIARYHRLIGDDVCLLSGGDENALKNVQAAEKAGVPVREFIDKNTQLFSDLAKNLRVKFDKFQRGSDTVHHFPSSQKLWNLCRENNPDDIYQKSYEGLYCLGCEMFYTPDELNENGECFEHPGKKLEKVSEKNYFFRLSKYQKQLIELIETNKLLILPDFRRNEVLSFLKQPLLDISISRSNERAKNWGVPVPGDDTQKIYVWFDALNIYQSGIGFGWDEKEYHKWWPADVHVIGKGISRFHAIYWPAFLLSAHLELPKKIFIHGYFTVNGQKMSKTLGNVIDPNYLIKTYGAEALRYYFLREIPPFADGDFSETRFRELYNADLANGLGNLVARVARLASQTTKLNIPKPREFSQLITDKIHAKYNMSFDLFRFDEALEYIWQLIKSADKFIDENEPWKQESEAKIKTLHTVIPVIQDIATLLLPFLPETGLHILTQFQGPEIKSESPLFPRIK
jgi:methionyl-tRNA synthetase